MYSDEPSLFPLSVTAFFLGLILEYRRLCGKWSTVFFTVLGSCVISLFVFIKFKSESSYDIDRHIQAWPYAFLGIFSFIGMIINEQKLIPRLTEGITLIQSLAIIYWVAEVGVISIDYILVKIAIAIGTIFCLLSFFYAFTYQRLSNSSRLTLSIWSSLMMMCFAADFLYNIYQSERIEFINDKYEAFYAVIQYFLLGKSFMYILQNLFMIVGFLPGKGSFFNATYFRNVRELKNDHLTRYEEEQIHIGHAVICFIFCALVFALNFHFQFVSRNFAVWATFITFPLVLNLVTGAKRF